LRQYERYGLVKPLRRRLRRFFTPSEIERLGQIRRLNVEMGLNLAGTAIAMDLLDRLNEIKDEVALKRTERKGAPLRSNPSLDSEATWAAVGGEEWPRAGVRCRTPRFTSPPLVQPPLKP
jgi:DNA-binding transcriptional MerR regulator